MLCCEHRPLVIFSGMSQLNVYVWCCCEHCGCGCDRDRVSSGWVQPHQEHSSRPESPATPIRKLHVRVLPRDQHAQSDGAHWLFNCASTTVTVTHGVLEWKSSEDPGRGQSQA